MLAISRHFRLESSRENNAVIIDTASLTKISYTVVRIVSLDLAVCQRIDLDYMTNTGNLSHNIITINVPLILKVRDVMVF